MALTKPQRKVVAAFNRQADRMKATPKERLALMEAGIVESGLRSLDYGDRDSLGPLQQRPSQGWGSPEQVKDPDYAARKFLQGARAVTKGKGFSGSAGQLAQAVQRSAFPGRYDEVSDRARQVAGASVSDDGGGGTSTTTSLKFDPGAAVNVAQALMAGEAPKAARPTVTAPALPSILNPSGYQPIQTAGPSEQDTHSDLSQQLQALQAIQNTEIPAAVKAEHDRISQEPGSIAEPHMKGSQIKELIFNDGGKGYGVKNGEDVDAPSFYSGVWAGHADHVHVAAGPKTTVMLGKLAQKMGLHVGENPHFGGVAPVHTGGSYHYKGEAIDVSGDKKKMAAFARRVKRYSESR